jgi:hypothetical protein
MDIISIERVWEDTEYFEIEVLAQSKFVSAGVRSYTTSALINELALRLETFPQKSDDRYIWENGTKGDGFSPFVSFEFWREDKRGHVIIEVYMEIDDGASYDRHNCCFYVKTEVGLLNSFGKALKSLNEYGTGTKITL